VTVIVFNYCDLFVILSNHPNRPHYWYWSCLSVLFICSVCSYLENQKK